MNFINKINKYLLEHYPLIWNTRLVWMIGANIIIHLLFFFLGYSTVSGIEDLKERYNLSRYFSETSALYYNFLISIVVLLVWIIFYLRNNAFKNTYNISKGFLFKQFCILFFIFFISSTQYFSYKQGLITKIKDLYSWQETDADIKVFNRTALFLTQTQEDYEIKNKKYPAPFPLEIAAKKNKLEDNIDTTKAYIEYGGNLYQFYKFNEELWQKDNKKNNDGYLNHNKKVIYDYENNYYRTDYKYRIVKDISSYKKLLHPSLLNYSKQLFRSGQDSLAYANQLKNHQKILENGNESEIKNELKLFLQLAEKYENKHNLTVDNWYPLFENKPNYLLKKLIHKSKPDLKNYGNKNHYESYRDSDFNLEVPYSKTLFLNLYNTDHFFKNVHEAYFPKFEIELLYILFVLSIIVSILLFIFKTTDIKTVLLSFVAALVVLIIIVWLMSSTRDWFAYNEYKEFSIMIFMSFVIIFFSVLSYILQWKKTIISVFWSLCLFAVPTFFIFTSLAYIKYLKAIHLESFPREYQFKSNFEIAFESYGFWVIIIIWILAIYLYSIFTRRLKARAT